MNVGKMGHWGYQKLILVLGSLAKKKFTVFKLNKVKVYTFVENFMEKWVINPGISKNI